MSDFSSVEIEQFYRALWTCSHQFDKIPFSREILFRKPINQSVITLCIADCVESTRHLLAQKITLSIDKDHQTILRIPHCVALSDMYECVLQFLRENEL
jgi:hypothetical protein